jgi:ABC-type transport system involved in multi-copper enzyme maturation permease subunit
MAVHNLGYRTWQPAETPRLQRTVVIATTGARRAWQSQWLRRMMFFAWLPALWFAVGFFIWEQSLQYPQLAEGMEVFLESAAPELRNSIMSDVNSANPAVARHQVWAYFLFSFFRYSQAVLLAIVVGIVAPPLISQDIRSRAFLIYFSRPIDRWEYIFGKLGTIWIYVCSMSTLPALTLYLLGVLLSPQLAVVHATWDLPLRVLLATLALSVPTATLALCISSLTQESRYAGFAWFTIWILGWVALAVMVSVNVTQSETATSSVFREWSNVSLYHMSGRVQSWIFGFSSLEEVRSSVVGLVVVSLVSLIILARRVVAPMRS